MHDFKVGDLVRLVEVAARVAREPARIGTVVEFVRPEMRVKVRWSSIGKPEVLHAALLQYADERGIEAMTSRVRERIRLKQQPLLFTWSRRDDDQLRTLLASGKGAAYAAKALSRTERAVRARARKLGVSSVRAAE